MLVRWAWCGCGAVELAVLLMEERCGCWCGEVCLGVLRSTGEWAMLLWPDPEPGRRGGVGGMQTVS